MEWLAALLTVIVSIFTIGPTLKRWFKQQFSSVKESESLAERFISLFASHGVHHNQISQFFGHDLTLHQCSSPKALEPHLTPEMLIDAADMFKVRLDWLQRVSDEIYEVPDYYKSPGSFKNFLTSLIEQGNDIQGYAIYDKAPKRRNGYDAIILLTEVIGEINERPVYRYYFCGKWSISYWKSRAFFAACCSIAWQHKIYLYGRNIEQSWIQKASEGRLLLEYDYEDFAGEIKLPEMRSYWEVDAFLEVPDKYLEGVDEETENYGRIAALSHWLELSEKTFMDPFNDPESHLQIRKAFESQLKKEKQK